jgi:hypothetical protein
MTKREIIFVLNPILSIAEMTDNVKIFMLNPILRRVERTIMRVSLILTPNLWIAVSFCFFVAISSFKSTIILQIVKHKHQMFV